MSYMFEALPRVRVYLVFNDADEDFPADCSILFEKQAARYLDMECLAMIAMVLAEGLAEKDQPGHGDAGLMLHFHLITIIRSNIM